jgi:hypothetical protein
MEEPKLEETLERVLLQYLAEHPRAMDSVEGIAQWWLVEGYVDLDALTRVLWRLRDLGVLDQIGVGPSAQYRLRQD